MFQKYLHNILWTPYKVWIKYRPTILVFASNTDIANTTRCDCDDTNVVNATDTKQLITIDIANTDTKNL